MSHKRWVGLYRNKQSPKIGDLIFAYHKGIHRVLDVRDCPNSEFSNKRLITYVQVADSRFNPIGRNRRTQCCDILWTTPFDEGVRKSNFVDPESIIQRVRDFA